MSLLYITEEFATMFKDGNQIAIRTKDGATREVGLEKVEGIVLVGRIHMTSPLITELLEREVPLTFLSTTGKFYGRLEPTTSINIARQREQFRRGDDKKFCLALSKLFINAKMRNSCVVLRRYNQERKVERVAELIDEMRILIKKVSEVESIAELMGYEGSVSKKYFAGLGLLVREEFKFKGRSRMPPKDEFNSLLSLGYTLLLYEIYTALVNKGLSPYASFMHQIKRGHPALASDLIEEWRALFIDAMVMNMVERSIITKENFRTDDDRKDGIYLQKGGLKIFISKFEERLRRENSYLTYVDYPLSFRESIQFQVGALVKAIEENDASIYRAVLIR